MGTAGRAFRVSGTLETLGISVCRPFNANGSFEIIFGNPFYVPHFGNNAQSIQHGVKTMVQEFESLIKINPNQWHSTMPIWSDE